MACSEVRGKRLRSLMRESYIKICLLIGSKRVRFPKNLLILQEIKPRISLAENVSAIDPFTALF